MFLKVCQPFSLCFCHAYTFSLQKLLFIKVLRKQRRVILPLSPHIHKKHHLNNLPPTQSQSPPSPKHPHTQPHHAGRKKKKKKSPVSIDSKRTRGRNRISSTAPPRFVRSFLFSPPPAWFSSFSFADSGFWASHRSRWPHRRRGPGSCQN